MKSNQEIIDEIMDEFDFERVRAVMTAVDWTWGTDPGEVPTISELRKTARYLIGRLFDGVRVCSTGGLVARKYDGVASLHFEVTEYEVELEPEVPDVKQ